jgi:pimeloyl-ACP methyl ester carboxylesterase
MAAALVNGDRRAALKRIKAPTVVIHGAADPVCGELLISPESAIRHTQLEPRLQLPRGA